MARWFTPLIPAVPSLKVYKMERPISDDGLMKTISEGARRLGSLNTGLTQQSLVVSKETIENCLMPTRRDAAQEKRTETPSKRHNAPKVTVLVIYQ